VTVSKSDLIGTYAQRKKKLEAERHAAANGDRVTLAMRLERLSQLRKSYDLRKELPNTAMRVFRSKLRIDRERPYKDLPPVQRKKRPEVSIETLVERMQRQALLPFGDMQRKSLKEIYEQALPALRERRFKKTSSESAMLAPAQGGTQRVAKLMDVAQFYRGSKRVIGDRVVHVNQEKKPKDWKYGEELKKDLDAFAEDWVEADYVEKRAQILFDAWNTRNT
jgi:hypothetical protein